MEQARDAQTRRAEPDDPDRERIEPRTDLPGRIQQRRKHDDGGRVLIVVQHWHRQPCAQLLLDLKAARRADVLEQDRPKGRGDRADDIDEVIDRTTLDQNRNAADSDEGGKQGRLPLDDGYPRPWADI